jgi:hypothetical protein
MTGHNYPDHFYADALARDEKPLGAYRSTDPVTKPAHYQRAGIETIDYIRATLDGAGFEAYCIGNVLKYVSRYREKGGVEDLRKAQVYLGWAIQPTSGNRPNQPEACNPAAMREAKIAYDVACDRVRDFLVEQGGDMPLPPHGRIPKWHPAWGKPPTTVSHGLAWNGPAPPNCDGLSARDIRAPHPMSAEAIRDHDERLSGAEDRL